MKINKLIKLLEDYVKYFYRNEKCTDNGLISFGKSLENISLINLISLDFCA